MQASHPMKNTQHRLNSGKQLKKSAKSHKQVNPNENIPAGSVITEDMIACKRPGTGIDPGMLSVIIGRRAVCEIKENELITWEMI